MSLNNCPVCSSPDALSVFKKSAMPCYNLERHESREVALAARPGEIDSRFCRSCGFTYNAAFDPKVMDYQVDYENARSHSPRYLSYLGHIASTLAPYIPKGAASVVEVGCGSGEFLHALKPQTGAELWGFDPAIPEGTENKPGIHFVRDYYTKDSGPAPSTIVLRHIMEHIQDPYFFLDSLLPKNSRPILYIEVPAWEWIAKRLSFYAFSYEHCSYYSENSLRRMLAKIGYEVRYCAFDFDNEYLSCVAMPGKSRPYREDLDELLKDTAAFAESLPSLMKTMRESFSPEHILWGAAGKGTNLLNLIDCMYTDSPVVIDSNPRRAHTFIPRTGQEVIPPHEISNWHPRKILLTNSAYRAEMKKTIAECGVTADIVGLDEYLYRGVV